MIRRSTLFACGVFLLFPAATFAQNATWTGGGDGTTWEDPANWSTGAVPSANANIGNGATVGLSTNQTFNEVDVVGDQNTGTAVLNQTAGTVSGGGWAKVGVISGTDGTYNLSGTASSTGHTQLHIGDRGGATGLVTLSDSATFTHSQNLQISSDGAANPGGTGTLTLNDNAVHSGGDDANIADSPGGVGTVNLNNNSTLNIADRFNLGFNGTGTLNVADSSTLNVQNLSTANGVGTGVINQTGGTINSNTWVAIGQGGDPNASGTYNHSGGTLNTGLMSTTENLVIGENGAGTYNASGTAVINNNVGTLVGRNATGDGLLEITGSTVTFSTGDLDIGLNSNGADVGANGEISWIADAGGVSTIFSDDNTTFGANSDLSVDLTADSAFSTFTTTSNAGGLVDIAVLVDNVNSVTGTFAGLAEGAAVSIGGGQTAFITYVGGDGNDIILQTFIQPIPEPASATILVLAGMGMMFRRRRS